VTESITEDEFGSPTLVWFHISHSGCGAESVVDLRVGAVGIHSHPNGFSRVDHRGQHGRTGVDLVWGLEWLAVKEEGKQRAAHDGDGV
jgi:hypothetical protein